MGVLSTLIIASSQTRSSQVSRAPITISPPAALPTRGFGSELLPKQLKTDLRRGKKRRVHDGDRIPIRVIEYMVTNRDESTETIRLITTIMDSTVAPAVELAALYQERWEFELTLDEVETHQMAKSKLLRSKTPELVRQELWALLLAHYAVRSFM